MQRGRVVDSWRGQNAEGGLGLKCRSPRAGWVAIPLWQAVRDHFSKGWWSRAVQAARTPHNSTNHGAAGPTVQPGVQKVQPIVYWMP